MIPSMILVMAMVVLEIMLSVLVGAQILRLKEDLALLLVMILQVMMILVVMVVTFFLF